MVPRSCDPFSGSIELADRQRRKYPAIANPKTVRVDSGSGCGSAGAVIIIRILRGTSLTTNAWNGVK